MFRATILPIIRSIRLYNAAWVMNHPNQLSAARSGKGGTVQFLRYQTTGRKLIGCFIPQAALYSLMLLMMGKIVARNMSS